MVVTKILIAIDPGEPSDRILEFGRMVADASGASLHLLSVVGYPVASPGALENEIRNVRGTLEALLDERDRGTRQASISCESGPPPHAIVKYAADHGIDLIVMGTHCHGPSYPLPLGSVADAVLRLAPCAVLAVKSADAAGVQPSVTTAAHA